MCKRARDFIMKKENNNQPLVEVYLRQHGCICHRIAISDENTFAEALLSLGEMGVVAWYWYSDWAGETKDACQSWWRNVRLVKLERKNFGLLCTDLSQIDEWGEGKYVVLIGLIPSALFLEEVSLEHLLPAIRNFIEDQASSILMIIWRENDEPGHVYIFSNNNSREILNKLFDLLSLSTHAIYKSFSYTHLGVLKLENIIYE